MGMNVNLSPQLEELVRSKVACGLYTSASEVVREALRLMEEQDRLREAKLAQLKAIDEWHMKLLAGLFAGLRAAKEDGETLLDRTMVLYGSNLGNANTHVTTNLPTLLAGGGFRHGQHLVFDRERNYPLPNLFVSMLRRMGLETEKFASSTGPMRGLDRV